MAAVDFGNVKADSGLQKLNAHLAKNSYVVGFNPTQHDVTVFGKIITPPSSKFPCAARWYRNIASYTQHERTNWPGPKQAPAPEKKEEDDFDLFGEETAEEAQAPKPVAAAKPKKQVINKSQLVIDVKPASIDTNLDELEKMVRSIKMNGIEWSVTCKKVPIAFGLTKLQIGCNIVDDLVETDDIIAKIECLGLDEQKTAEYLKRRETGEEDEEEEEEESSRLVQSSEIVSFNKL